MLPGLYWYSWPLHWVRTKTEITGMFDVQSNVEPL
jgi:hypothetical protein